MNEYEIKPSLVSNINKFKFSNNTATKEILKKNKLQEIELANVNSIYFYSSMGISELNLKSKNSKLTIRGPHINVERENFENKLLEFKNFSNDLIDAIFVKNPNCVIKIGNPTLYFMSIIIVIMLILFGIMLIFGLSQGKGVPYRAISPIIFVIPIIIIFLRSKLKPRLVDSIELKIAINNLQSY